MKIVSWLINPAESRAGLKSRFILSPYLSLRSLKCHPAIKTSVFIKFLTFSFLTAFSIVLANQYLAPFSTVDIILISPTIYFFTEMMGAVGQGLFYKNASVPIHRSPLKATSLSRFWGHDWNLWIQDWLRDVTQNIHRGRRGMRMAAVFLLSGFFHEMMCNLPYWIMYRKSYFGTMMGYFVIQAVALWIDKKYIKHWPKLWRRVYLWAVVILPSPLFINVPLLTFLGFRYE